MGLSNLINNLDVQKAKEWANQQSEAKWAAEQEEKRRQERAEDRKKISGAASKVSGATTGGTAAPKTTGLTQVSGASSGTTYSAAREKAAEQAQQAAEPPKPKTYGNTELSYSGAGASDRTKELEAQWFAPKQPEAQQPAVTVSETGTEAQPESSGAGSKPRRSGEERAEAQAPIVYTPQGSTTYSTAEARTTAANTKGLLTEEESGMSEEQLAWLQTPEGQRALANQQAKQTNDETLRNSRLNTGISFSGQPITQDKRLSGQPMRSSGLSNIPASTLQGMRGGTPPTITTNPNERWTTAYNLAYQEAIRDGSRGADARSFAADFADRTVQAAGNGNERTITFSGQPVPESTFLTGQDRIDNEQLAYERGAANYLRNNGAQVESNGTVPIVEWFRKGQAENNAYDQAYQEAYNQVIAAGGSYNQADTVGQNAGDMAVRNYRAQQPATPEAPVNEGTSLYDEIRAAQQNSTAPQQPATTRNGSIKMTTSGGVSGGNPGGTQLSYSPADNAGSGQTAQNGSVKMTTSGGVSGGQTGNNRPGAEAALPEIMEPKRTGEERAEKQAPKGSVNGTNESGSGKEEVSSSGKAKGKNVYFKPSYGQAMDKGVKLPYKAGGYTEKELRDAGNIDAGKWGDTDKNFYEGYYLWNGKYYPVDQEKAAYYIKNGGSYKGWEEPMREYYNTFGTFYGYRPDWKTAGGKNVWKQNNSSGSGGRYYSNRSNNLSYSGASSGRSYGRGSTANNGMYWNGLTSWNA